ncbi:MAG: radical SAM protein [Candidatus Omnitrophota bacterium]
MAADFKYIYGPVFSWRLGSSLGIDLLSGKEKACSFDCIYCQVGKTRFYAIQRKIYAPTKAVVEEIKKIPKARIDYITFSGRGEPTLAKNLGEVIRSVKRLRKERIAVLTNSSLMNREDVREELALADFVIAKLDASSEEIFGPVNKPAGGIGFKSILSGMKKFRKSYNGRFGLQVMFMDENKKDAAKIAELARAIDPDEVQLNTPLRPCGIKPLSRKEMDEVRSEFRGINTVSAYDVRSRKVVPISGEAVLKRRPETC